jgi:hypothetical protein
LRLPAAAAGVVPTPRGCGAEGPRNTIYGTDDSTTDNRFPAGGGGNAPRGSQVARFRRVRSYGARRPSSVSGASATTRSAARRLGDVEVAGGGVRRHGGYGAHRRGGEAPKRGVHGPAGGGSRQVRAPQGAPPEGHQRPIPQGARASRGGAESAGHGPGNAVATPYSADNQRNCAACQPQREAA